MVDLELLSPSQIEDELQAEVMRSIDPYWMIEERTLGSFQAKFGQKRVQQKIDEHLPNTFTFVPMETAIQQLQLVRKSDMMKWCGDAAEKDLACCLEVLLKLREGATNQAQYLTSDYHKVFGGKLGWFCKYEFDNGKEGEEKGLVTLFAKEAAARMLADLESQHNSGVATERSIAELRPFSFLLESGGLTHFHNLSEQIRKAGGGLGAKAGSDAKAGTGSSASTSGGAASKGKASVVVDEEPDAASWSFFS